VIVKISPKRGSSPVNLMAYLFGPGQENEHRENVHTDMRVIASDGALGVVAGQRLDVSVDRAEVVALGQRLDFAKRMFGTEVPGGHVWHCSLSLPAGEELTDEQWAAVAHGAVEAMGFTETGGKAGCRWIAVNHGTSSAGNAHIHLAVNLVRGDGTKASIWNDRRTMSKYAAKVERELGLFVVEGRAGAGQRGLSRAELERAASTATEPERVRLARIVRGHAVASADEAEFARRLLDDDQLLARPRFAAGGQTAVTGYSVALLPEGSDRPLWFGGGRLGADLSLPKVRTRWSGDPAEAVGAWAGRGTPGREVRVLAAEAWPAATAEIQATTARLVAFGAMDAGTWAGAMREAAGVFAVLSTRLEPEGGPLGEVADALAALSWPRHESPRARRAKAVAGLRGVAMVCRQASRNGDDATVALIIAMFLCVKAIQRARLATEHAAASKRLLAAVQRATSTPLAFPAEVVDEPAAIEKSVRATRSAAARSTSPAADRAAPNRPAGPPPARPPSPPQRRPGPDLGR